MLEKVAVIIPMFNASSTVASTLSSVGRQSYKNIDIIVVDDGSTDDSAAVAADYATRDPRVRLIRQPNLGVATARNIGAASTSAEYLAFVDADDLWAPSKIELQMDALRGTNDNVGAVYCWSAHMDAFGNVWSTRYQPTHEGCVLRELCRKNIVGNGSSLLIKRAAFEAVGGYDPSLRSRHAQGCEDLLISLRIAEYYEFKLVRRFLVGYRLTDDNMSSDVLQMLRSFEIISAEYKTRYPAYATELRAQLIENLGWLMKRALKVSKFAETTNLLCRLAKVHFWEALVILPRLIVICLAMAIPARLKKYVRKYLFRTAQLEKSYAELAW
jgi:glycosyltransferase involved in cell wall biosynthesis